MSWGSDGRGKLPERAVELTSHFHERPSIAPGQFGSSRKKVENKVNSRHKDQHHRRQSTIGCGLQLAVRSDGVGSMLAGIQKTGLEGPALGEIVPPVILVFPAGMSELPDKLGGEGMVLQSADPGPLLPSGLLGGCPLNFLAHNFFLGHA